MDLLPPVVAAGTDVGVLPMPWFDIPKGKNMIENNFSLNKSHFHKKFRRR